MELFTWFLNSLYVTIFNHLRNLIKIFLSGLIFWLFTGFSSNPGIQTEPHANKQNLSDYIHSLYDSLKLSDSGLDYSLFDKALTGYFVIKGEGKIKNRMLSIIDFDKPSTEKRLWIIDLKNKKVLFNTLVAHGKNSGENMAVDFSNSENSFKSSLGFYLTGNTYCGKHGLSLILFGLDKGYNSNAEKRYIVMHGADYVSEDFIRCNGRLGRSHGCPAIPSKLHQSIIDTIKSGSALFIYNSSFEYQSQYLNKDKAEEVVLNENFS